MPDIVDNLTHSTDSTTLADRVFYTLQEDIVRGVLLSGKRLSEAELAAQYGISRGPLREALRRLEARRLISRIPNVGVRVVALSTKELLEIYAVRELMEGMAARLAALNLSKKERSDLQELLTVHEQRVLEEGGRAYFQEEGDLDFHYRIAQGCGNTVLTQMLCGELYHRVRHYRYKFSAASGRPQQALAEHRQILEAIITGDAEIAELLMRRHIRQARLTIAEQYHTQEDRPDEL